jgi:hypothetical protein
MFTESAAERRPSTGTWQPRYPGVQATLGSHCQTVILLGNLQERGFGAREDGEAVGD